MDKIKSSDFMPKTDVRQLIKINKTQTKRVDHPHARYNQLGRISCIVCGIQIKSEFVWQAHVLSKSHKQNESRDLQASLKRPAPISTESADPSTKLARSQSKSIDPQSSSNGNEQTEKQTNSSIEVPVTGEKNPAEKTRESNDDSKLPKGFFDDEYKDAKARNVPFKDKVTAAMELFQKEMVAVEKESEQIVEQESQAMTSDRDLLEIDTQIMKWERIQQLQKDVELLEKRRKSRKQDIKVNNDHKGVGSQSDVKLEPKQHQSDSASSDDSDLDEIYNFRTKSTL